MSTPSPSSLDVCVVDESVSFSLIELSRACASEPAQVALLVREGILEPLGKGPDDWVFPGAAMRRARIALRLCRDLEVSAEVAALIIDLLDEIESLRSRLRRAGIA